MIGTGALLESLEDPRVESVLSIGRTPTRRSSPKLRELVRTDLFDYADIRDELAGHDACLFCLGASVVGMSEAEYHRHRLTHGITIAAAVVLCELNPGMRFCFVSGVGTDSTESGSMMWARVKGKPENRLLRMPLDACMFRPGFIQPMKGAS